MASTTVLRDDALSILNASPDNYLILLPDAPRFTIAGVTDAYLKATFTKRDQIIGKGLFEIFPDNPNLQGISGVENLRASLFHVLEHKHDHHMDQLRYDVPDPNGGFVYKIWRSMNRPVFDQRGEIRYILHATKDVTAFAKADSALKNAEQALKESELRFRTMANSIPQLAWMTDENGWIYWYNDRWYEYTGTTPEEMLGWGWRKVHHPDLVEGVVQRIKKAFESGSAWEDTFLLRSKEGEYRWFLSRALPARKEDGTLIGWIGTNTDITEQRKTEEALEKSEQQLLLAMQGGELGHFDYNPQTGELKWSARMKQLFGVPQDTPVDYNVYLNALYFEDRERTHNVIQNALHPENGVYENEYRVIGVTDGKMRWLRSKAKAFFDENGRAYRLSGVTLDITKQKEAEEALQRSESTLRNLVLQAPVAMCIGSGSSFVVEVANDRMLELWQKRPEEIIGRPVFEVLTEAGEQGLKEVIQQVNTTGQRFTANEMPVLLPRDDKLENVYLNFVYEPIKNREGVVTKIIAVAIDVTDQVVARKKIEERVAERTKELQQSNEDLQQFAHVSSHDLKEPLRKTRFFAKRLCDESEGRLNDNNKMYLSRVQASADRMWHILDGVLSYSQVNFLDEMYERVDLNEVMRNVASDLELPIQEKAATIHYSNLPTLDGAPVMLYLVFYNLVSNSLKFARKDVPPVITITADPISEERLVRISVKDNGIGFEQKYAEKIFGTFSRLHSKDKYEGAGLGLSICKKIVNRHGGTITAKGLEDAGTIFEIVLPMKN